MRKHARGRVRSRGRLVLNARTQMVAHFAYIQCAPKWTDWNFRTISLAKALQLVALGEAEAITRQKGGFVQVVGYRALKPTNWEKPSPTTLTYATMVAVGNADALNLGRDDRYRLSRRECDEIVKFRVWPLIGDTRAVAVRPRITDAERLIAEKLLRTGGRTLRELKAA
jgi:hypothetical protein